VQEISVPGKAMLFGEYGVLFGGPAVAVTLPGLAVSLRLRIAARADGAQSVLVRSAFFPSGGIAFSMDDDARESDGRHLRFFASILEPYRTELRGHDLEIEVVRAFSPTFGFGSSSAILVGVHRLLRAALRLNIEEDGARVERMFAALAVLQPRASGYDVAIQDAALCRGGEGVSVEAPSEDGPVFWMFQRGCDAASTRVVAPLGCRVDGRFGLLLSTGCYSDTAQVVERFSSAGNECFAAQHRRLAEEFLRHPVPESLPHLFARSREVAREQGILPHPGEGGPLAELCRLLDHSGLQYKTMGAGGGDSLWVLVRRESLREMIHPVTGRPLCDEVSFDFASWSAEERT
jgi:mevalonate kinase